MQLLKKITLTHVLLFVLILLAFKIDHSVFLLNQSVEDGVEFQQQTVDTLQTVSVSR